MSKQTQILQLIWSAIKGEEHDYTSISLKKAVLVLSIPMMLEMIMESVFAVVDIYYVNRLGEHAGSVVGLTESVLTIVYSIGIGMSAAATALVSRRVGEKNYDKASQSAAQAITLGLIIALLIGIPAALYSGKILELMGAEPAAIKSGINYTRIMFASNVVIILLFLINGIFRGAGNAAIAMKSLWLGNIINIVLDPCLIFGFWIFPEMGIEGAATATVIGRTIAVLYQFWHLFGSTGVLKVYAAYFKFQKQIQKSLIEIASPATFQFIIASSSWIFLAAMVAYYGSAASAGYQTAIRLVMFFILPAWGMSNAAATLVGQNLGAGHPDRAEHSVRLVAIYNVVFMAIVSLLFLAFSNRFALIFIPAESVDQISYASKALKIMSAGYIFYGIGMVLNQAFNGAGDTKTPTWVYFFGFWVFQVPFAYYMHHYTPLGAEGVFMAVPIAETLMSVAIFFIFRKGKWKQVEI